MFCVFCFFGFADFLIQCQVPIVIGTPKPEDQTTKKTKNQQNNKKHFQALSLDLWFLFFLVSAGCLEPHRDRPTKTHTNINAIPAFSVDLCCFFFVFG